MLIAASLFVACRPGPPTQTVVCVYSEARTAALADELEVVVRDAEGNEQRRQAQPSDDFEFPARIPLVPKSSASSGYHVEVELRGGGMVIGRSLARGAYQNGQLMAERIWFLDACLETDCAAGERCVIQSGEATCVEATSSAVRVEERSFEASCPADGGCSGGCDNPCESCVDGACVPRPEGSACGPCAEDRCVAGTCVTREPGSNAILALYRFTEEEPANVVRDAVGAFDGLIRGEPEFVEDTPKLCGAAIQFPIGAGTFVEIPDDPAWDIEDGSVDFWVRSSPQGAGAHRGLVSRDADFSELPGHFGVYLDTEDRIVVRIQSTNDRMVLCSEETLETNRWTHVAINFGRPEGELFIDGVEVSEASSGRQIRAPWVTNENFRITCGEGKTLGLGITGNDNPWVLGASSHVSAEGAAEPIQWFTGGAMDTLHISAVRRDFASIFAAE